MRELHSVVTVTSWTEGASSYPSSLTLLLMITKNIDVQILEFFVLPYVLLIRTQDSAMLSDEFIVVCICFQHTIKFFSNATTTRRTLISASKSDSFGYDGKMVDENMILLRMRIREIEVQEMKGKAPSDWSEWEKKYFQNYGSDVCEALGLLQRLLINTRPSLALTTFALLTLTMSMSIVQLLFHFVAFVKGII
ncbi:hypothetical protein VNO80_16986 [Phaseolus coccineus]|uniref:Uncharacterized protein n=1 Tax=Phaseolus coccineus TaxID=3886 RepID=A0AAN9MNG7_PHACN